MGIMKTLISVLLLLPLVSLSQDSTCLRRVELAGEQFRIFSNVHATGVGIELGGVLVSGIGVAASRNKVSAGVYVGGAISLVGAIISLTSFPYIRSASIIMRGGEIDIPINPKRKRRQ